MEARLAGVAAEKEAAERQAAEMAGAAAAAQQMWQLADELRAREAELKVVTQERAALAAQASGRGAAWAMLVGIALRLDPMHKTVLHQGRQA